MKGLSLLEETSPSCYSLEKCDDVTKAIYWWIKHPAEQLKIGYVLWSPLLRKEIEESKQFGKS